MQQRVLVWLAAALASTLTQTGADASAFHTRGGNGANHLATPSASGVDVIQFVMAKCPMTTSLHLDFARSVGHCAAQRERLPLTTRAVEVIAALFCSFSNSLLISGRFKVMAQPELRAIVNFTQSFVGGPVGEGPVNETNWMSVVWLVWFVVRCCQVILTVHLEGTVFTDHRSAWGTRPCSVPVTSTAVCSLWIRTPGLTW